MSNKLSINVEFTEVSSSRLAWKDLDTGNDCEITGMPIIDNAEVEVKAYYLISAFIERYSEYISSVFKNNLK